MKWEALSPYIYNMIVACALLLVFLLIIIPKIITAKAISTLLNSLAIQNHSRFLLAATTVLYLVTILLFVFFFARQGIRCVSDLAFNNFITTEMTYISSEPDKTKFKFSLKSETKASHGEMFSRVSLQEGNERETFYLSFPHSMQEGARYTVTYGKHSKVLLSVLSQQEEQALLFYDN